MSIKKTIRKKLNESKRVKENTLIEQKIVRSRLMMIVGDKKLSNLSEEEQGKISVLFLMELSSLNQEGFLNEGLSDILKTIFGAGVWAVPEAIAEKALNSILGAIGLPDNSVRKFLVSFFATNPKELMKSFSDCNTLVKHIARAIMETMVMNLSQSKGYGGTGWDILRNILQNQLQSTDFIEKIEQGYSSKICELFGKYSANAKDVVDKLKPALSK